MLIPLPFVIPYPAEAIHAAPIFPMEPLWCNSPFDRLIMEMILSATSFAVIPEGIPVLGGAGVISVPFLLFLGLEIPCGGAKAIPGAKMLG